MTNTKRMHRPMTEKQIVQYQELQANLIVQAELIMSVFCPLNDRECVAEVKFEEGHTDEPCIEIWYSWSYYAEERRDYFSCPESYLGMTENELKAEKKRLKEEEERKKAGKATKAKATMEKRKEKKEAEELAEKEAKSREEEEARKKRYQMFLELSAQFEGTDELGHWGFLKYDEACCSKCGHVISLPFYTTDEATEKWGELPKYCEECGTKMDSTVRSGFPKRKARQ